MKTKNGWLLLYLHMHKGIMKLSYSHPLYINDIGIKWKYFIYTYVFPNWRRAV